MTSPTEKARLALQERLDGQKSQLARNKLGQFATPAPLAMDIIQYARDAFSPGEKVRFLDPAFGTGSFYSALLATFPHARIGSATGFEIDPHYGIEAVELWKDTPLKLEIGDFTKAHPPSHDHGKPNLIICNPPYVRHHHLASEDKLRLRRLAQATAGIDASGLSGLYCYFMLTAQAWMADKGLAVWLVPSEFMDVNYGKALKDYLLERVHLLRIHRFDPSDVQFGDALVSSAIVCFTNEKPRPSAPVEFTYGGSLIAPKMTVEASRDSLKMVKKWTGVVFADRSTEINCGTKLSDLFVIRRGIATGSNGLFVLNGGVGANLPREFLRPILPSPRYLKTDYVDADESGMPVLDNPMFLLDCRLPEDQVMRRFPALWDYLEQGKRLKIHEGYICRHREPWYSQESRLPAPILCTYMGRKDKDGCAFRFILNKSSAIAANVYLMLYPKPILARQIKRDPELLTEVWRALNAIPHESLTGVGRVYGGGLHKLEPNELADAPADAVLDVLPGVAMAEPMLF